MIQNSLSNHYATRPFFTLDLFKDSDNYDVYLQYPIYFEIEGIECKALPDMIIIYKKSNTVQIIDLKTTSETTTNFIRSIRKYRYDIQLAWYSLAVFGKQSPFRTEIEGVKNKEYLFLVETTLPTEIGNPAIYSLSQHCIQLAISGDYECGKVTRPGILQLLSDYKYYKENGFGTPRVLDENDHLIEVKSHELFSDREWE
jgi:hypothetical protein